LELPGLYAFAYHMCGNRAEAQRYLQALAREAAIQGETSILEQSNPGKTLLGMLARNLEEGLGRKAEQSFDVLDQILRSDITRPIDLRNDGTTDPTRVHLMLWELKRTCLTSVMGCLPPGVRLSFVLTDLLGYSPVDASNLLHIKESAYRVRLTRARKRIEDYLTPRCYHVDRQNPCTCAGRLAIAVDARFIDPPLHTLDIPHEPHDADGPRRDMGSLYRGLPQVKLTDTELQQLAGTA